MSRFVSVGAALLAILVVSEDRMAYAQQTGRQGQGRAFQGLFGQTTGDFDQSIGLNASLGGGYDDNLLAELSGRRVVGRNGTVQSGTFGSASVALGYNGSTAKTTWAASANSSTRLYPGMERRSISSHSAQVSLSHQLRPRTGVNLGVSAVHRPFWMGGLFQQGDNGFAEPTDSMVTSVDPVNLDVSGSQDSFLTYYGTADIHHRLTSRTTASLGFGYRGADTQRYSGRFQQQSARARLQNQLSSSLALNLGYGLRKSNYGTRSRNDHLINAGVDFNKSLSFSRRTTVAFGTGSAIYSNDSRQNIRLTGNASLNHDLGRSWLASAHFNRGLRFLETISVPFYTDSAAVSVGGFLGRRVRLSTVAQSVRGVGPRTTIRSSSTAVSLGIGLTRFANLETSYNYFVYEFGGAAVLPEGVPRLMERQGVRIQIALWAPIYQHVRRGDAAR